MKFQEMDQCIKATIFPTTFVYFLINEGEVVYVGQTNLGMSRIYAHKKDNKKQFDETFILPCEPKDLNRLENLYILKYKPIYNKLPNLTESYSIKRAVDRLNETYLSSYSKKCNRRKFLKMMEYLNLTFFTFNNISYISHQDLLTIDAAIENYIRGVNKNEVFNIGF